MSARPSNRLAREASPYLQQHGHNPVDWYPWGDEALQHARREDKPILLSIGYSACHWCHVMEQECFDNDAIAAQMNRDFVCIKVDREERPDLDQIYQLVVQLMGRNGGWPLTVFLTPEQTPFFGGTYFPPNDRYGIPGFPRILDALIEAYRTKRTEIADQAKEFTRAIAEATGGAARSSVALSADALSIAARKLLDRFDAEHGGFGSKPKFPNTMAIDVLLLNAKTNGDDRSRKSVELVLETMRNGGIYDQLGGGFHRYSTDERWLVPHFEKMLYDNALLIRTYCDAHIALGDPSYASTVRETIDYVRREMTSPDGGFYATQDADSEGVEGSFFVWTRSDVRRLLKDDAAALEAAEHIYGITEEGNFEGGHSNVLSRSVASDPNETADALERAHKTLFTAREKRERPFRDEKILASWNGLMIGAFARAGSILSDATMIADAERALAHVERALLTRETTSLRLDRFVRDGVVRGPGFLDDYAYLADAAVDLYEATGTPRYVQLASDLVRSLLERFWDETSESFFFTARDSEALICRSKDPYDHAVPSGASIACQALLRLGTLTYSPWTTVATRALEQMASLAIQTPLGMSQTMIVLDRLVRGSTDIVLVGEPKDARTRALAQVIHQTYVPHRTFAWLNPASDESLAACSALAEGKVASDAPAVYVCRNGTCSLPIRAKDELARALRV